MDIEWSSVYSKIYASTIDVKLRAFQYKILNNCLYLNEKLHLFKIVESPKCSLCNEVNQSINHLFLECKVTKHFYADVQAWLNKVNVCLPLLNLENILLGLEGDTIQYFLLLIWKYVIYLTRAKQKLPKLNDFILTLTLYEKMEYIIAKKRSRLASHMKKYENIRNLLYN